MKGFPVSVLWAKWYKYQSTFNVRTHVHDHYYQVTYLTDGGGIFTVNNETMDLSAGQMMFCRPREHHSFFSKPGTLMKTVEFKILVYDKELRAALLRMPAFLNYPDLRPLIVSLYNEGVRQESRYHEMCNILMFQIIVQMLRYVDGLSHEETAISKYNIGKKGSLSDRFEEIIRECYTNDLSLVDIAQRSGYNMNYLCSYVKKHYGCTVMGYLNDYRLQRARELIIFSELNLSQIAGEVGFKSIHHFSRQFKERYGVPPSKYREREKEGLEKDIFFDTNFSYQDYVGDLRPNSS